MAFLQVKNIKKSYEDTQVLKGINFDADKSDVIVVLGPSGVGKTTLLRCLNFLERADEGIISIADEVIFDGSIKKIDKRKQREAQLKFGLVFQSFNLFPQYSVLENVMLAKTLQKDSDKATIKKEALEILDSVGLSDKVDNYPYQLSGGQKQRAAIARALILKPQVLCFDEPTSALDPSLRDEVTKVIRALKKNEQTIFIVTHDMEFAKNVADRILVINNGIIDTNMKAQDYFSRL